MKRTSRFASLPLAALTSALLAGVALPAGAAEVTTERLENADAEPQNWLTALQNYSAHRYSRLTEINRDNVGDLKMAFTLPIPTALEGAVSANLEGPPLVVDGMMYFADSWGTTYKVDVNDPRKVRTLWVTDPATNKEAAVVINASRGIAIYGPHVFANLIDGRVVAYDDESGEIVWDEQVAGKEEGWDFDAAEGFTAAPLVAGGKLLVGQSKGDWGTRGWLAALDPATGEEQWRSYTIPGPGEPGHETWSDDHNAWRTGGGSLWQTGSYDPEQRITIWGTANPVPMFDPEYRPGDNLYTNSAIAWDIDTGAMKWYFQYTPNESWDYDEIAVHLLFDAEIGGETRKVVGHFARNGFFYELDRTNGQFIGAVQFTHDLTWTAGLDPKTGKPVEYDPNLEVQTYIPENRLARSHQSVMACPTAAGGVRWQPPAFNPERMIAYAAGAEGCMTITNEPQTPPGPEGGNPMGVNQAWIGGGFGSEPIRGAITAVDVTKPAIVAKLDLPYHNHSGVLATAGGLLFTGNYDGTVNAYNDETLEELWGFSTGIAFKAPVISYAIGDKQYIAVMAGGEAAPGGYPELALMKQGAMLYVFAL